MAFSEESLFQRKSKEGEGKEVEGIERKSNILGVKQEFKFRFSKFELLVAASDCNFTTVRCNF